MEKEERNKNSERRTDMDLDVQKLLDRQLSERSAPAVIEIPRLLAMLTNSEEEAKRLLEEFEEQE